MTEINKSQFINGRRVSERRQAIIDHTHTIGINEAYISYLVDTFYSRVREDDILGPIFNSAVEDWDRHLPQMKKFWASVTMNAGTYTGKPVPAHVKHQALIQPWHFDVWLKLFEQTLKDTASTSEAVDYFMERAERIAQSLRLAMFGIPGLGVPKYESVKRL